MTTALDDYDLERIRVRMRSGMAFTTEELVESIGGSNEARTLVDDTIGRFLEHGYIQQDPATKAWSVTELGKASFAPAYEVPPRG